MDNNSKINILLVDDVKANLLSISNILESDEYNIFKAENGNEALSLLLDNDFALVLMDVMMPGMDGFEVAEIMKTRERTRGIPIIFITAMDKDEDFMFKGYESGAIDFMFKPINSAVLRSKVKVFCMLHKKNEELNRALQEKDFLIKEIHHRVKNNLIMVNSFINLQRTSSRTEDELELLGEVESRIATVLLIHEKLYSECNYGEVNISEYLSEISCNLLENLNSNKELKLDTDIDNIILPVDPAISLGLLLTEMLTNTIKYAFPDGRRGRIGISLKHFESNGHYRFSFYDDGIGIEEDKLDTGGKSLGLTIIRSISRQLNGELRIKVDSGTEFELIFPPHDPSGFKSI